MLLLIDIGNTNITIGFYYKGEIRNSLRLRTIVQGRDSDEYSYILTGFINHHKMRKPRGAVICSVVPEVTSFLESAISNTFGIEPVHVSQNLKTGLKFQLKNVETLGADRIANAVAAHNLYEGNLIVVDFGTATTFCAVTEKGEYIGGAIMPGVELSALALAEKTSKLPLVELKPCKNILGKNTAENIRTGVILGHAGAVERIISEIIIETGKDFTVLATGGLVDLVKPYIKAIDYVNHYLTFEGLILIYELNL